MVNWKELVKSYLIEDEPKGDPIEKTYEKHFPLSSNGTFSLNTIRGSVRITTHQESEVKIHAVMRSETGDQERLNKLRIIDKASASKVSIEVDYSEITKIKARDGIFVHFIIGLPEDCSLILDASKAEFDVDCPSGSITVMSGKARGKLKGIRNAFEYSNQKGNLAADMTGPHPVNIIDQSGNVQLTVRGPQDYRITGGSQKGLVNVNGADVNQQLNEKRQVTLDGILGGGTHAMKLNTQKGNINVTFVD